MSKRDKSNPSTYPSSQAQETHISDPYLAAIEQALGKLSDVDRNTVAQHIKELAKMSKKRRHAILTLTEEEACPSAPRLASPAQQTVATTVPSRMTEYQQCDQDNPANLRVVK